MLNWLRILVVTLSVAGTSSLYAADQEAPPSGASVPGDLELWCKHLSHELGSKIKNVLSEGGSLNLRRLGGAPFLIFIGDS